MRLNVYKGDGGRREGCKFFQEHRCTGLAALQLCAYKLVNHICSSIVKTAQERTHQGKKTIRCLFQCKVLVAYGKITYHMFSDSRRREEMLSIFHFEYFVLQI